MLYRSKAPLRLGLAGGGTDVSPYSDLYGGAILNATISLHAHSSIELLDEPKIVLEALDRGEMEVFDATLPLPIEGKLQLAKGIINRIAKDYGMPKAPGFKLSTYVDAPAGSGLGTSSTLVVSIIGAFAEALKLPLGEYDIAHYAFEIERKDLQLAGGKQDQYAATFGGFNFMEFYADDKVIVNPLRIRQEYLHELENNLVLYFTATSRESANIIKEQQANVNNNRQDSLVAMHNLKEQARLMKEALLRGQLHEIGAILDYGFQEKTKMAHNISNSLIEEVYNKAKNAGATGGKISGAGGGGFMFFYCPGNTRYAVTEVLKAMGGEVKKFSFTQHGQTSWTAR
ncbi:D-glycero-alpha-D-manno-heptose-7-phosphate kinase [Filimonas lacunae]|uniref:D-glycero-alpha-D-manno-heptose-7-phosphate kinase n=1 Tax=Filimonas lacunae TaxID=477680 RepID=A0A173MRS6_9BACT|nr:dehydrogenase [Filimonas lacunae]BAV10216.1 D,D-heptose 7-phosphate kinase [Filimonas lacunae]SIT18163.1 D-glycero-alpha-D-manno-heptose-7-phosphate kinase [Filimonas lacunae]